MPYQRPDGQWRATVKHPKSGKRIDLGLFPTREAANESVARFRQRHHIAPGRPNVEAAIKLIGEDNVKLLHIHGITFARSRRRVGTVNQRGTI